MCAQWKEIQHCLLCRDSLVLKVPFVNQVWCHTGEWFIFTTLQVEKKSPFWMYQRFICFLCSIYMWMHLCVCMGLCVCDGMCLYLSVTVYTLSAWGHLDWMCVVISGESAHMCLHEDLLLCGCVFDKLWEHVGDCLSIHLERKQERKSRMRRWRRSASSRYAQVNLLPVARTSLSLLQTQGRETGGETDSRTDLK